MISPTRRVMAGSALTALGLVALPGAAGAAGPPVDFAPKADYDTGTNPFSVALGDVNGDSKPDIVTAHYFGDNVSLLLGNGDGDGTFATKTDHHTGARPISVALGDVNKDGKPDIVTANFIGDNVSVLLGNGNGTFATKTDHHTGARPISVALGDVNKDGKPDIVTANHNGNNVSVLLGNGNGTFATNTDYPTGTGPYSVALGDVDGDTKLDMVTANFTTNNASVLLGNGDGTFATNTDYPTGTGPRSVALGDVNGDTKPDIVTANYNDNKASVLLNTTALALSFTGDTMHITPPPASTVGIATKYMIQYNTQARIDTPAPWGVWAINWPANKLAVPFPDTQTKTACETFTGTPTICYRPAAIGIPTPGTTYVYRVLAHNGTTWTPVSNALNITRPTPPDR